MRIPSDPLASPSPSPPHTGTSKGSHIQGLPQEAHKRALQGPWGSWSGQDRTGQDGGTGRAPEGPGGPLCGQNRTGKDLTGQDRTGQDRTGQDIYSLSMSICLYISLWVYTCLHAVAAILVHTLGPSPTQNCISSYLWLRQVYIHLDRAS